MTPTGTDTAVMGSKGSPLGGSRAEPLVRGKGAKPPTGQPQRPPAVPGLGFSPTASFRPVP
jgi:hypothetical protein